MGETEIQHMHDDLEIVKQDLAVIKYILSEEGMLIESAKKQLQQARKTPKEKYLSHEDVKKKYGF